MARKRYSPEQIISMLREAEVIQSKGSTIIEEKEFELWTTNNGSYAP